MLVGYWQNQDPEGGDGGTRSRSIQGRTFECGSDGGMPVRVRWSEIGAEGVAVM